jgi:ribosome-associated heat shock protein Hsp15
MRNHVQHNAINAEPSADLRIDKWLWYARFFKSRSLAAKFVMKGKIRINRQRIKKASVTLKEGDVLTFALGPHIRVIEIVALGDRRGPAPEAQTLYLDLEAPPHADANAPNQPSPSVTH